MKRVRYAMAAAALLAQLTLAVSPAQAQVVYVQPHRAHAGFFHRHPYAAAAGVGALTGGLGGIFLGSGLLHGAAVGAGTHSGFHWLKQKWQARHSRGYY